MPNGRRVISRRQLIDLKTEIIPDFRNNGA
jgi:hypothetical protein